MELFFEDMHLAAELVAQLGERKEVEVVLAEAVRVEAGPELFDALPPQRFEEPAAAARVVEGQALAEDLMTALLDLATPVGGRLEKEIPAGRLGGKGVGQLVQSAGRLIAD